MIIAAKKGRSIIVTTHFLDEADVLSDRIGIIKGGKLITCGSSLFLKHHFGVGYQLSFDAMKPIDVSSIIG
jgi:ATP-binding cassette subfamily A (ABC1) protein 3